MAIPRLEILKETLEYLQKSGVPLTKITIQKALYFVKATGLPVGYSFEPYYYGPYSAELAEDLDDLCFWDQLKKKDDKTYDIINLGKTNVPDWYKQLLHERLSQFIKALDKNFNFANLELVGTVAYCCRALKNSGDELTEQNLLQEVRAWKGRKYADKQILHLFRKIKDFIQ